MKSRDSKSIILVPIENKSKTTIHPLLQKYIKKGSRIYTDKMATYVIAEMELQK